MAREEVKNIFRHYRKHLHDVFSNFATHLYFGDEDSMSQGDWLACLKEHGVVAGTVPETPTSSKSVVRPGILNKTPKHQLKAKDSRKVSHAKL